MYLRHFKLSRPPFAMNPDPSFLYPSPQHAQAATLLEYAIESQAGFCVVTGEIGSGKTTLMRQLLRNLGDRHVVGLVSNTHTSFTSIHPWVVSALAIAPRDDSEVAMYEAITQCVVDNYALGRRTLLVIDEAQNLAAPVLEELRLLSNVNSEQDVALQVLLLGQPELRATLARPELAQFAQRIAVDFHLRALDYADTLAYIQHRLIVAGATAPIFRDASVRYIHAVSGGVPRLINQVCDLALVYAFAEQVDQVDAELVAQVVRERLAARAAAKPATNGGVLPRVERA